MIARNLELLVPISFSLLVGCATGVTIDGDPEKALSRANFERDVCQFGKTNSTNIVTQTTIIGDYSTTGDITTRAQITADKYAAAIAVPYADEIEHTYYGPGTCKKWFNDPYRGRYFYVTYYPDCEFTDTYKVDYVYGLARRDQLFDAEQTALENCEASVEKLMRKHEVLEDYYDELECRVVSKSTCS